MFDKENVTKILKSFYILTGVKVVILDAMFNEILSYPHRHCDFCEMVNKEHGHRCRESEMEFCKKARSIMNLYTGRCHANLVESVLPITEEGMITGYLMFGQILPDGEEKTNFPQYGEFICSIVRKTKDEIDACTHVLKGLAYYIMSMHPISITKGDIGVKIAEYIGKNISGDLSIDALCKKFSLSRSKLYNLTEPYMPGGIAKYIKRLRLKKATDALANEQTSVRRVALETGYGDYNYFCKDFKKTYGVSPGEYRIALTTNTKAILQK